MEEGLIDVGSAGEAEGERGLFEGVDDVEDIAVSAVAGEGGVRGGGGGEGLEEEGGDTS